MRIDYDDSHIEFLKTLCTTGKGLVVDEKECESKDDCFLHNDRNRAVPRRSISKIWEIFCRKM